MCRAALLGNYIGIVFCSTKRGTTSRPSAFRLLPLLAVVPCPFPFFSKTAALGESSYRFGKQAVKESEREKERERKREKKRGGRERSRERERERARGEKNMLTESDRQKERGEKGRDETEKE